VEYTGVIQDVTKARVAEETLGKLRSELAHVARVTTLGALTASIAHEVNQTAVGYRHQRQHMPAHALPRILRMSRGARRKRRGARFVTASARVRGNRATTGALYQEGNYDGGQ